ncbi:hypothetical protein A9Q99_11230 [Gammaproteobacteria bacterium 45_16_T64]|nr:hypothetical protein A9Q99_11230 [Gammaproteobacteria bacterium 45_16_T64]
MTNTVQTQQGSLVLRTLTRAFQGLGFHTTQPSKLKAKYESDNSQYVTIDGTTIHYTDEGQGPILVLSHGVMASLHTWDGWVERLKSTYRIIRFDIPGFGLSDPNAATHFNPEYTEALLNGFVNELQLDEFYLVGNSLGGFISWNYAASNPDRVKKLILIDPIGYEQKLPFIMKLVSLPVFQTISRWVAPRFIVDSCVKKVYGQPQNILSTVFDRYFDLLSHPGGRDAMVDVFLTFRYFNGRPEIVNKMKMIQVPTLIMWGRDDAWVPVEHVENWKRDVQASQAIIYDNAGHIPMEEYPAITARDADRFLSS